MKRIKRIVIVFMAMLLVVGIATTRTQASMIENIKEKFSNVESAIKHDDKVKSTIDVSKESEFIVEVKDARRGLSDDHKEYSGVINTSSGKICKAVGQGACITSYNGEKYMLCSYVFSYKTNEDGKTINKDYGSSYIKIFKWNKLSEEWRDYTTIKSPEWGHMNGIACVGNKLYILKGDVDNTIVVVYLKDIFLDKNNKLGKNYIYKEDGSHKIKGLAVDNITGKVYGYEFEKVGTGTTTTFMTLSFSGGKYKADEDTFSYTVPRYSNAPAGLRISGNYIYILWDYHGNAIEVNDQTVYGVIDIVNVKAQQRTGSILLNEKHEYEQMDIVNVKGKYYFMIYCSACPNNKDSYYGGKAYFVPMKKGSDNNGYYYKG